MPDQPVPAAKPRFGLGSLVAHPHFGLGRVMAYDHDSYVVLFKEGDAKRIPFAFDGLSVEQAMGNPEFDRLKQALAEVLGDHGWLDLDLELGKRWVGGTLKLIPGRPEIQPKEIPLEVFFKKVIGIREKLRVLEQKINNHPALSAEDKLELEGYVTRCYGSLTSFNVLFAHKESLFKGQEGGG